MAEYYSFDEDVVREAIELAQEHFASSPDEIDTKSFDVMQTELAASHFAVAAQCIEVTIKDGKVCLNMPFKIGKVCLPIKLPIPDGTVAEACITICTTFGIPTGVKVKIVVGGKTVVQQTWGVC